VPAEQAATLTPTTVMLVVVVQEGKAAGPACIRQVLLGRTVRVVLLAVAVAA